ncbi:MAG: hypothetical protein ACYC2Y_03755 [Armatimonadota bacterium]
MANPVDKYRAAHRRLRRYLDPYTALLCPECPAPCCRKPTKVAEFDVLLANACGCSLPSANASVSEMVRVGMLALAGNAEAEGYGEPCDYLGEGGCIFPGDLRPYECARYICPHMKRAMSPKEMREVRALLHKLGTLHRELLDAATQR